MKNLKSWLLLFCLVFSHAHGETLEERVDAIEKDLAEIKELLRPFQMMQGLANTPDPQANIKSQFSSSSHESRPILSDCIKVTDQAISVIEQNEIYTEFAWKAEFQNTCNEEFGGYVIFEFYDEDEFLLEQDDSQSLVISANSVSKARGTRMLVADKGRRVSKFSASLRNNPY